MSEFPIVATGDRFTRQALEDSPDRMLAGLRFDRAGAIGAMRDLTHAQVSCVQTGRFRGRLGGEEREVGPGATLIISSGLPLGCACIEPGTMNDSFTPRRDDSL